MASPGDRYIYLAEGDRTPSVEAIRTATMQWDASGMFGGHCETTEDKVIMLANLADTELNILKAQIADLKEQSALMDSVHKEMMEKLERYRKALEKMDGLYDPDAWLSIVREALSKQ